MKSIALFVVFVCACVIAATSARAEGLRMTPAHPAPNEPFTIDFDYRTTCSGGLIDPIVASVQQPGPGRDSVHIEVSSGIDCSDLPGPSRVVHMTAAMPGIPAGYYPIYSAVSIYSGFIPYLAFVEEGNVTVGSVFTPVPTLSSLALLLLTIALGIMAITFRARWTPKRAQPVA